MKSAQLLFIPVLAAGLLLFSCTPKTAPVETPPPVTTTPTPPPVDEKLSPCPKFTDVPNKDEVETNYVLYRDFLKANKWQEAFDLWQKVYAVAPAADGKRNTVYADGIRFYEYFMSQTQDAAKKNEYVDKIFAIYDQIEICYKEGGYVNGRKGFDLYYKYSDRASKEEIYAYLKKSIDEDVNNIHDFVINPFVALMVELHAEEKVSSEEAKKYNNLIRKAIAEALKECKGTECDRWKIVDEYAPARLEYFETVQGFYDCAYYEAKYWPDYQEEPNNCDVIATVYSRLKWGGCSNSDAKISELLGKLNGLCAPEPTAPPTVIQANNALREGKYAEAIRLFEQAGEETSDSNKKASFKLLVAKIYYAHLKNFGRARQYANEAANLRSGWGEPYLLIGRLYASSGPLCGPGRGWDSQIVVWPAVDMWSKARSVDPSVASEANRLIGQYSKYMPNIEEIFQRGLKEGSSFYVGCWIQANTTIRAARE